MKEEIREVPDRRRLWIHSPVGFRIALDEAEWIRHPPLQEAQQGLKQSIRKETHLRREALKSLRVV